MSDNPWTWWSWISKVEAQRRVGRPTIRATWQSCISNGYPEPDSLSRRLEREAGPQRRGVLADRPVGPDFKTIADFRKEPSAGESLRCGRAFTAFCGSSRCLGPNAGNRRDEDRAVASRKQVITPEQIKNEGCGDRAQDLAEYLATMDEG